MVSNLKAIAFGGFYDYPVEGEAGDFLDERPDNVDPEENDCEGSVGRICLGGVGAYASNESELVSGFVEVSAGRP